jgi:hypothetical protein
MSLFENYSTSGRARKPLLKRNYSAAIFAAIQIIVLLFCLYLMRYQCAYLGTLYVMWERKGGTLLGARKRTGKKGE